MKATLNRLVNLDNSTNSTGGGSDWGWGSNPHTGVDQDQKLGIGFSGIAVGLGSALKSVITIKSAVKNYDMLGAVIKGGEALLENISGTFLIGLGCYMTESVSDQNTWLIALAIHNALLLVQNAAIALKTTDLGEVKYLGGADERRGSSVALRVRLNQGDRHQGLDVARDEEAELPIPNPGIQQRIPLLAPGTDFKHINSMLKTLATGTIIIMALTGGAPLPFFIFLRNETLAQAGIKGLLISGGTGTALTTLSFLAAKRATKDETGSVVQNHYIVPRMR